MLNCCLVFIERRNNFNPESAVVEKQSLSHFREEANSVLSQDAFERLPWSISTGHFGGFLVLRFRSRRRIPVSL